MRLFLLFKGRTIYALVVLLIFTGCNEDENLSLSNTLDAGGFTVNAPEGWRLVKDVGYDSYVGRIVGPSGTIYYDQGFLRLGLDHVSANERTIYFKHVLITGMPAILHKEKTLIANHANGKVVLTAHIQGDDGKQNRLYLYDPGPLEEKVMLEIIKTHKFK